MEDSFALHSEELLKVLQGRKIVKIDYDGQYIELDNGVELKLEQSDGSGNYNYASISNIDVKNNIITNVVMADYDSPSEGSFKSSYTLHILSKNKTIAQINVEEDADSEWYLCDTEVTVYFP